MPNSRHLPHLALLAALTTSLIVGTAQAAEWKAEPSVTLRGEYDDNFRLTSARHDDVWGTILMPSLKLSRSSDLWDFTAGGRLRAARYTGEDGLNTVDNYLDLAAKRRLERGSFDASASLIDDTTLQSEVLDFDTGLTINQIDRSQRNLRLAGQYMFTEATWLEASVAYSTVSYDQGELYGLLDYDYLTPGLTIVHQYTQQLQLFTVLNHSRVDYDTSRELESKTNSLQLGAAYDITETWKVRGSIGSRKTTTSELGLVSFPPPVFATVDSETTGLVYDASISREFETGSIRLSGSQSVTPSSTGTDTESTRISLDGSHDFSAKLSAALAVSYYQTSAVGDVTTRANNDRYRIAPSLSWRLDEELALRAGYTYTRVDRSADSGETVDSNAVFVSLGYTWPRMSVSR